MHPAAGPQATCRSLGAAASSHRALVERIIESEKPAHVTYDLEFAGALLHYALDHGQGFSAQELRAWVRQQAGVPG